MAGTGAKKIEISCTGAHKRKKCGIQKDKERVVNFLPCPGFEAKLERQLCERECFPSAQWIEKLILPDGRRRED